MDGKKKQSKVIWAEAFQIPFHKFLFFLIGETGANNPQKQKKGRKGIPSWWFQRKKKMGTERITKILLMSFFSPIFFGGEGIVYCSIISAKPSGE